MKCPYLLCSSRLEGTDLLAELLDGEETYRFRALVRDPSSIVLENCDFWIAASQTEVLFVDAAEVSAALADISYQPGGSCWNEIIGAVESSTDLSSVSAASVSRLLSRVRHFLRPSTHEAGCSGTSVEQAAKQPQEGVCTAKRKVVLCQIPLSFVSQNATSSISNEFEFRTRLGRKLPLLSDSTLLHALAELEWFIYREFYPQWPVFTDEVPAHFDKHGHFFPMDTFAVIWVPDTNSAIRMLEQFSSAKLSCRVRESETRDHQQFLDWRFRALIVRSRTARPETAANRADDNNRTLKIDSRTLAKTPGIGLRRLRTLEEQPVLIPFRLLERDTDEIDQLTEEEMIIIVGLRRFLTQNLFPEAESATSLLHLDFISHRRLWFE